MRVLVVDPDEGLAREVSALIGSAGFDVVHATSPDQMEAYLRIGGVRAVFIDLSRRRMDGFSVARSVRAQHPANALEIVPVAVQGGRNSPEVAALRSATSARFVLERPVSLDEVLVALNTPLPAERPTDVGPGGGRKDASGPVLKQREKRHRGATGNGRGRVRVDWAQFAEVVDLWLMRKSGILELTGVAGAVALVSEGGIVDPSQIGVLKRAVGGRAFRFSEQPVDGSGDWASLGGLLFEIAKARSDSRTLRRYAKATVGTNTHSPLARLLPLSDDARRFVRASDGRRTVHELADVSNVSFGDVSASIVALVRMGLFSLAGYEGDRPKKSIKTQKAFRVAALRGSATPEPVHDEQETMHKRLLREVETVSNAAPAVVLGVPADAPPALVERAADRMRTRYATLSEQRGLSAEDRALALTMVRNVERAHKVFHAVGGSKQKHSEPVSEVDQWLHEGKRLLADGKWAEADKVLSQAHTSQIDDARVMANLGWARLHNPEKEVELRTEEGQDLLLLAEQFDPTDSDGQFYLAQVLMAANQVAAAEQRAARAVGADPDDTRRRALLRKIRLKQREESGPNR